VSFQQKTGAKRALCKVGLDNVTVSTMRHFTERFRSFFQVYIPNASETFKLAI